MSTAAIKSTESRAAGRREEKCISLTRHQYISRPILSPIFRGPGQDDRNQPLVISSADVAKIAEALDAGLTAASSS
jgi:hypothetical protein